MARSFDRSLADLNTKLNRQRAAVAATEEMIEAVHALKKAEEDKVNAAKEEKPNAPPSRAPRS